VATRASNWGYQRRGLDKRHVGDSKRRRRQRIPRKDGVADTTPYSGWDSAWSRVPSPRAFETRGARPPRYLQHSTRRRLRAPDLRFRVATRPEPERRH